MQRYAPISLAVPTVLALTLALTLPVLAAPPAGHARQDFPPRPGGTPFVVGIPLTQPRSGASSTALSPAQVTNATAVARQDVYVKRLLAGRSLGQASTAPWLNARKQIVGAVVRLPLARPARIDGQWLALRRRPYAAAYAHVVAVRAFVDLNRRQVVALVPTV